MSKSKHKRPFALLLCTALLFGQPGTTVYAKEQTNTGGLCQHHTAHDDACGYAEAVEGHACEHEHTQQCYTSELICGDVNEGVQTASGSEAGHQHVQECYRLDCPHERGEHKGDGSEDDSEGGLDSAAACGYIEAVKSTPCAYVCDECGGELIQDNGNKAETGEPENAVITITAFDELSSSVRMQTVPTGTTLDDLTLPDTLSASGYTLSNDTTPVTTSITITGVAWELTGENNSPTAYEDGRTRACNYYFQPKIPGGGIR